MKPDHTLLFLFLVISITGFMLSGSLITFLFCLFWFWFTLTSYIIHFPLHVAMPQSAYTNHLTNFVFQVLVSAILFFSTPRIIHVAPFIGVAAAAMYKFDPFNICINYARQLGGNLVPALIGLCISATTILFICPLFSFSDKNDKSSLGPIPIELLFLSLNYFNFLLTLVLLFISRRVPTDGTQVVIPAVVIEYLVEAVLGMSSIIALIDFCMVVQFLVGIISISHV
jgi:hypothetical protein